jgi:uncharacterized membrane protein
MHDKIDASFEMILKYVITGVEIIGALIIVFYTIRALISLLQKKHLACRDNLTMGITTGLNFLLTSEVLNTIIAPDWSAIGMTCAILLMRAGMTLLIHWENKMEKLSDHEKG